MGYQVYSTLLAAHPFSILGGVFPGYHMKCFYCLCTCFSTSRVATIDQEVQGKYRGRRTVCNLLGSGVAIQNAVLGPGELRGKHKTDRGELKSC